MGLRRGTAAAIPIAAVVLLALEWGRDLPTWATVLTALALGATVLVGVHHAEVVAHRVGEPMGSLVLAVAVTVIEVGLILSVMAAGKGGSETLARDTVFAAIMITCNGILGLCLVIGALRERVVTFNAEGAGSALAAVATLAVLSLVLPTLTTSAPGPVFTTTQLTYSAVASVGVWLLFVVVQTVRNREWFLPVASTIEVADEVEDDRPGSGESRSSMVLLLVSLVGVVGLAKLLSPTIERAVADAHLPLTIVGVVIALLVLLPETLSAVRAARRGRIQTSINLAYGSAMASIGLTIPVIALATIWLSGPVVLGLGATDIALLALTVAVGILTVTPGRATLLQGGVHLAVFAGFLVLAANP
jgi:Ca2+:H+ antiporter